MVGVDRAGIAAKKIYIWDTYWDSNLVHCFGVNVKAPVTAALDFAWAGIVRGAAPGAAVLDLACGGSAEDPLGVESGGGRDRTPALGEPLPTGVETDPTGEESRSEAGVEGAVDVAAPQGREVTGVGSGQCGRRREGGLRSGGQIAPTEHDDEGPGATGPGVGDLADDVRADLAQFLITTDEGPNPDQYRDDQGMRTERNRGALATILGLPEYHAC